MIAVEYDAELGPLHRSIDEELRAIIPACDPDGRGRVDVRVTHSPDAGWVRAEVRCGSPAIHAIAVHADPVAAIRGAFARVRDALGALDLGHSVAPESLPTS